MVTRLMVTRIVFGLALSVVVPATLAATTPVGATPGSFAVNQNGGATYTIPIAVPPGTAGMVPNLTLTYDKQVQNDLLGVGWSVSGLSLIQRCGRTIALDGVKGGVNYDTNDRFCLDGQRLIAINNGVYGANGTEYRTEKEIFSRIISYRDDTIFTGSGRQYFRVTSKSGTVMEYGVTLDSRIEAQGKATVRVWALNKLQDTKGHYLAISYFKDTGTTGTGEYHPTRIDYTGNATALLTPYNSVQFIYGPRTDITPRYEGGSLIQTTQRLTNVKTCTGVTSTQLCTDLGVSLVRDYQLAYDPNNGAAGGSRLLSVTECGSDGVCLPATTFAWEQQTTGFPRVTTYWAQPETGWDSYQLYIADINGDGKSDLVWNSLGTNNVTYIALSNGDGTFTRVTTYWVQPELGWSSYQLRIADINGDGKSDLVWNSLGTNNVTYVALSNGDGTFTRVTTYWVQPELGWSSYQLQIADINGDGKSDLVWNSLGTNNVTYVALSNGDGTFTRDSTYCV